MRLESQYLQGVQDGRVEIYMQYGKQSPYVIQYNYIYQGKEYHHKSCFLWEKPDLAAGDSIMVCVNDSGKSTILL